PASCQGSPLPSRGVSKPTDSVRGLGILFPHWNCLKDSFKRLTGACRIIELLQIDLRYHELYPPLRAGERLLDHRLLHNSRRWVLVADDLMVVPCVIKGHGHLFTQSTDRV